MRIVILKITLTIIFLSVTLNSNAVGKNKNVTLRPCIDGLMGFTFLDEYSAQLRRIFLTESDVKDLSELSRFIILPSFEKEQYISILEKEDGSYALNYSEPDVSIWGSIQNSKAPEQQRNSEIPHVSKIKTMYQSIKVTKELHDSVNSALWSMMYTSIYPQKNEVRSIEPG